MGCQWKDKIFTVTAQGFEGLALELFRFQYENNSVYHEYVNALRVNTETVHSIEKIPFLPIRFFKSHEIQTTSFAADTIFESSGTTGSVNSRHLVKDIGLYEKSFIDGFELFYGPAKEWCIIGLLPSYLERQHSSLIYMVNKLIALSGHANSGFYLNEFEKLFNVLKDLEKKKQKTLLIGVTFGLLDFAEAYSSPIQAGLFDHTIIMETGGMKGRRREMIRQEVHGILKESFHVPGIHSEYGMTELLSQAYSDGDGIFQCPPWMKVLIRDDEDPLRVRHLEEDSGRVGHLGGESQRVGQPRGVRHISGAINIIDMANVYSCSFIATDDAGKIFSDGSFEVLGRMDNSDLRGCSLMVL